MLPPASLHPDALVLHRVQLRGGGRCDALAQRQRVERDLRAVCGQPSGLPAGALLLVRRLRLRAAPGLPLRARMEQALAIQARAARRPLVQHDASAADAVWFADVEELLACLVRDALARRVDAYWWWAGFGEPRAFIRAELLPRGDRLLAVAARLAGIEEPAPGAASGWTEAWCASLDAGDAAAALTALQATHAASLQRLGSRVARAMACGGGWPASTGGRAGAGNDRSTTDAAGSQAMASDPFNAAHAAVPMPPASRRLLASLTALLSAAGLAGRPQAFLSSPLSAGPNPVARDGAASAVKPGARRGAAATAAASSARSADVQQQSQAFIANPRQPRPAPLTREEHGMDAGDWMAKGPPGTFASGPAMAAPTVLSTCTEQPIRAHPGAAFIPFTPFIPITRFGGLFYLLNAALAMRLWPDFTAPRDTGLALSPWDWLARLGRDWWGADFVGDPLWPVLAELAGRRPEQSPGRGHHAPQDWFAPPEWLAPWGDAIPTRQVTTRHRIRQLHPAGFAVSDLARGPHPCAATARQRWWRHLRRYLEARLALAIGCDNRCDAPATVCRHAARLHISPSAVEVHLALADLPLPIRIAGLDRDPGWIPAAGRSVSFHFT